MDRLVVADTGPLIHLAQADALSLLERTGRILIPEAVIRELDRGPTDISDLDYAVVEAEVDTDAAYPQLDPGETAALHLCSEREALLVTDDLTARTTAQEEEIEVHGSVGIVLSGYSQGALSDEAAKAVLRDLVQETNLYLSAPLVDHAFEQVESDDAGWE